VALLQHVSARDLLVFVQRLSNQLFTSHSELMQQLASTGAGGAALATSTMSVGSTIAANGVSHGDNRALPLMLEHLILLIGGIATGTNLPEADELLVPALINRACLSGGPLHPIDELLLQQLVQIALLQRPRTFSLIAEFLLNVYRKHPADRPIHPKIPGEIIRLARGLRSPALLEEYFGKLLTQFQFLASNAQRSRGGGKEAPILMLENVACIIPAVACVAPSRVALASNPALLKLLRTFWFYCVKFRFAVPRNPDNPFSDDM
jgi:hypothetical protein